MKKPARSLKGGGGLSPVVSGDDPMLTPAEAGESGSSRFGPDTLRIIVGKPTRLRAGSPTTRLMSRHHRRASPNVFVQLALQTAAKIITSRGEICVISTTAIGREGWSLGGRKQQPIGLYGELPSRMNAGGLSFVHLRSKYDRDSIARFQVSIRPILRTHSRLGPFYDEIGVSF